MLICFSVSRVLLQWLGPGQDVILGLVKEFGLSLTEQVYFHSAEESENLIEAVNVVNPEMDQHASSDIIKVMNLFDSLSEEIDIDAPWNHSSAQEFDHISVMEFTDSNISSSRARLEVSFT